MHTENQLPRLPGSALKVPVWGGVGCVGSYPLLSLAPTHVEFELGCDNYNLTPVSYNPKAVVELKDGPQLLVCVHLHLAGKFADLLMKRKF